ncbi:hypothetical protein AYJ54_07600 [Bradyrhizobium centrolobii]|uniref:Uncharacterized protein n=1 Tax=Bradyrhizobium centrolobii TaxID=1505087 RepID=A0A176YY61_9BRAD|nr:hypothetical protein [Bradyrhizobium centrolobii]OAF11722.1 hypothetical protein AYJ54_07600 [Bradyrhizobium centrolobii]
MTFVTLGNGIIHSSLFLPMEKVLAYAISGLIMGFGVWIFVVGLSSSAPALWSSVALLPTAIGLWSAFGDI